jgi:hypothetical protein
VKLNLWLGYDNRPLIGDLKMARNSWWPFIVFMLILIAPSVFIAVRERFAPPAVQRLRNSSKLVVLMFAFAPLALGSLAGLVALTLGIWPALLVLALAQSIRVARSLYSGPRRQPNV